MDTFLSIHQESVVGTLSTFDRNIFKGHMTNFYPDGAFARFLSRQGILLKEFKSYVSKVSGDLKSHAQQLAQEAGRQYLYLQSATTRAKGRSKEELARQIAEEEEISEGLICVLSVLEPCSTFTVRGNRQKQKLEVVRRNSKCLHFYFYFIDPEFGFMHVRLQSWFPFQVQIYINGREWLARQLAQSGITYERYENSFTHIDDLAAAQQLCDKFAHRSWPRLLNAFARKANPFTKTIKRAGFGSYYWVIDQCEYATDVMFADRSNLLDIFPDLVEHALSNTASENVMRFLGRKFHGNFKGEVTTDLKKRPEGWRIKHRMKRNSIKMYDKWSILRIETTINNPREFKVLRVIQTPEGRKRRWKPMNKGVANIWRYSQVSNKANQRYLTALAQAQLKGKAIHELDALCRCRTKNGKRFAKFNPVSQQDADLFAAALAGEHAINGFRNRDLRARLYDNPASSPKEATRRCARVSRLIAKLRGHGLVAKVKNAHLYRVTERGYRVMSSAISFRQSDFPLAFQFA